MVPMEEHIKVSASKFGFVLVLFLVLIGLAHGWAEVAARQDESRAAKLAADRAELVRKAAEENKPAPIFPAIEPPHTVVYYRILFTIWVTYTRCSPANTTPSATPCVRPTQTKRSGRTSGFSRPLGW